MRTREVQAPFEYYHQRLPYTTVLRDPSAPKITHTTTTTASDSVSVSVPAQAVTWILTHSAGDIGALHTLTSHRRRGLARYVTCQHLERQSTGDGVSSYSWVSEGNTSSERLWETLGWTRGWAATWVRLRDDDQDRLKTVEETEAAATATVGR